jgi:hypothetical protein
MDSTGSACTKTQKKKLGDNDLRADSLTSTPLNTVRVISSIHPNPFHPKQTFDSQPVAHLHPHHAAIAIPWYHLKALLHTEFRERTGEKRSGIQTLKGRRGFCREGY